jgi:hypothetical protein
MGVGEGTTKETDLRRTPRSLLLELLDVALSLLGVAMSCEADREEQGLPIAAVTGRRLAICSACLPTRSRRTVAVSLPVVSTRSPRSSQRSSTLGARSTIYPTIDRMRPVPVFESGCPNA